MQNGRAGPDLDIVAIRSKLLRFDVTSGFGDRSFYADLGVSARCDSALLEENGTPFLGVYRYIQLVGTSTMDSGVTDRSLQQPRGV
jgi:hypothetical protein